MLTFLTAMCTQLGCSKDKNPAAVTKTYVLVHGAWQASYVWQQVKEQLEKNGQKVVLVELPAHGSDATLPVNVTMDSYRDKVISAMSAINVKVVLVGHSMGGMVVSAVAEKIPGQIEKLIFIAAFVPTDGQSLLELSSMDKQSLLGASIVPSADQLTLDIRKDSIVPIFCQDAPVDVQNLVLDNFKPEPAIPFTNKVSVSDARFGKVDKYYVHTLQDHAIGIDLQNQMVAAAHITKVYSLNTGHSPFLSQPSQVANLLLDINK
jgi:pimeloyl-ACP methyl ester carboxylesterase